MDMWQRLTKTARQTVCLAGDAASQVNSKSICPEHFLIALVKRKEITA